MKKFFTIFLIAIASLTANAQLCGVGFQYTESPAGTVDFFASVNVNDSAAYPIVYTWTFGDGTTLTSSDPYFSHIFTGPGTYTVCVTILTATGCTSNFCDVVTVTGSTSQCTANFIYYVDSVNTGGYTYSFIDYSTPDNTEAIVSWSWNFSDGSTSTLQNPIHTYTIPGTYAVCLSIATSSGCVSTSCANIVIANTGCQLYASLTTQNPTTVGGSDGFIESYVYGGTPPYTYMWNTGQITPDIYGLTSGLYTFYITDANGCSNSYTTELFEPNDSIGPIIDTLYTNIFDSCLNFVPDNYYVSTITVDTYTNIVTVEWIFTGSGMTSTIIATYTFDNTGNYVVVLSINCAKAVTNYYANIQISTATEVAPLYGNEQDVFAYPVPFKETLNVAFTLSQSKDITMYISDATGRIVANKKINVTTGVNQAEINTQNLPSGVYILNIVANGQTIHKQIVK